MLAKVQKSSTLVACIMVVAAQAVIAQSVSLSVPAVDNLYYYTGEIPTDGGQPPIEVPLPVGAGTTANITASGCAVDFFQQCIGPNGDSSFGLVVNFPAEALIGRWSTSQTTLNAATAAGGSFLVGPSLTITAPSGGGPYYLFLGVNDDYFYDNSGALSITVNLQSCQVTATAARMTDDHTLEIDLQGQFSSNTGVKVLTASTILNSITLTDSIQLTPGITGIQTGALSFDLTGQSVPRFTQNARFSITPGMNDGGSTCVNNPQKAIILLPVIIVPGILHGGGGDGTFNVLESYLESALAATTTLGGTYLGESYELRGSGTGYPTLFTLPYSTNRASFGEGAEKLRELIREVKANTWADNVNIVSHSKGGLVARKFLEDNRFSPETYQLIMAQPPNLGALAATWANIIPGRNYGNLFPLWPWTRFNSRESFRGTPNRELEELNNQELPNSVKYTVIASSSEPTDFTRTGRTGGRGQVTYGQIAGDGTVPLFSQLGIEFDPNNPNAASTYIPAFAGTSMSTMLVPGPHQGYLSNPDVEYAILTTLLSN